MIIRCPIVLLDNATPLLMRAAMHAGRGGSSFGMSRPSGAGAGRRQATHVIAVRIDLESFRAQQVHHKNGCVTAPDAHDIVVHASGATLDAQLVAAALAGHTLTVTTIVTNTCRTPRCLKHLKVS